jgi:hypothetical protein
MRTLRRYITLLAALTLLRSTVPAAAADSGDPKDVKQVRSVLVAKVGYVSSASVSHDWALCTAYIKGEDTDVSVVLRRTASVWKIVEQDGGAYTEESLKALGVPQVDIPQLLKANH